MTGAVVGLMSMVVVSAACAQQGDAPPPPAAPPIATPQAAPEPNAEGVKRAHEVMAESAKAYRAARAITDEIKFVIQGIPTGDQTTRINVAVGQGADAQVLLPGLTLTSLDGKLYVERQDTPEKYFSTAIVGDLSRTLNAVFGDEGLNLPHLTFRFNDDKDAQRKSLTLGMLNDVQIIDHKLTTSPDNQKVHEIVLHSPNGGGSAFVDAATKLVKGVSLRLHHTELPSMTIIATLTMSPRVLEQLEKPIAFDPAGREAVASMDDLEPAPREMAKVGDAAPDFTLADLGGEKIALSALRGSVVVLDFWAVWCKPCVAALPTVQQFADWAKTSKPPVKVFAVNVEGRGSPEDILKKVSDFWKQKGFTMTTLLDYDTAVLAKYGFQSIPTTVVIDPSGKITSVHTGAATLEQLKADVAAALKPAP